MIAAKTIGRRFALRRAFSCFLISTQTPKPARLHMKTNNCIRKASFTLMALVAGALTGSATVTPYAWYHAGENGFLFDSGPSGGAHSYSSAFSSGCLPGFGGGGNASAVVVNLGVGGPLGNTGYNSIQSTRWGAYNCNNSGMWIGSAVNGSDAPPTTNQWDFE